MKRYKSFILTDTNHDIWLDSFVTGKANQLARAAAIQVADNPGTSYNPLFLYGGVGLGKTHLMHAIGNAVVARFPRKRVVYVTSEKFTNDFITCVQQGRFDDFRARYRRIDLLLIDDIQFIADKERTQEEFFHTFNAIHDEGKQIVLSSDRPPRQIATLEERLRSRFEWGLIVDIQPPELETRVAILRKKAQAEKIDLADDVVLYLAQSVRSNVRELEGTLIRLAAKSSLLSKVIDLDFVRAELAASNAGRASEQSVEDIQRIVCHHFKLRTADLLSKDRHKSIAFARHVAMYLCKQRLKCSFPELGRAFGNRDHTTVMSAVRKVDSLRQNDAEVRAHLDALERKLGTID